MANKSEIKVRFENFKNQYIDEIYLIEKTSLDVAWAKEQLKDLMSNPNVIARVGLVGNEVVCSYSFYVISNEGDLNNLCVKENWRGRGIGNLLIEDMIYCAKKNGVEHLTLEVNEHNKPAIRLYVKHGFDVEGVRTKFYNGTDSAIIMWKRNI